MMGKFWTNVILAMTAMFFTATTPFSITRQSSKGAMSMDSPIMGQLFRSTHELVKRNAPDIDPYQEDPCVAYYGCVMPSRAPVPTLLQFDYGSASQTLAQICPNLQASLDCDVGECYTGASVAKLLRFTFLVMEWSCEHRDGFDNGTLCWGASFTNDAKACLEFNIDEDQLIECAVNVPNNLSACSEEDADFVRSFITLVVNTAREVLIAK